MNIIERLIAWLEWNKRPCEERDLLNDALEELEQAREQLQILCDGVNRRCDYDNNQLPLVSVDRLTARLAEAEAKLKLCLERASSEPQDDLRMAVIAGLIDNYFNGQAAKGGRDG
jgi:hypothetical protein